MAFSQPASSQMQLRMKQSIAIYNKQIADLNTKIPNLEASISVLQNNMELALQREAQTAYELINPTGGVW